MIFQPFKLLIIFNYMNKFTLNRLEFTERAP
jgi:hypothetical protein